jgi:transposase-like protein
MDRTCVAAALGSSQPIDALQSQYELLELEGGAVVYAFTGFPKHYACPHCFAKHVKHALQYRRIGSGYFECPGCKTSFPVKQSTKADASRLAKVSVAW